MSSLQKRKAQLATVATVLRRNKTPPGAAANEVVNLLRIAVEHLAAMRAMMEAAQPTQNRAAIPQAMSDTPEKLEAMLDLTHPIAVEALQDPIATKAAADMAQVSDDTMRRWVDKYDLGVLVAGDNYVSRSKLEKHLAAMPPVGK